MFSQTAFVCLVAAGMALAVPSSLRVTVSPSVARYGSQVTLTAVVTPANATGRVTFYQGITPLGTSRVNAGTAVFTTSGLSAGNRPVRAIYSGDTSFSKTVSGAAALSVRTELVQGFGFTTRSASGRPLATADFNSDGILDVFFVDTQGDIQLGRGDGRFQLPLRLANSRIPVGEQALAADFDGDGFVDLAMAMPETKTVRIVPGRGDGTFRTPIDSIVAASNLILADLNNDGFVDLIGIHPVRPSEVVLLANDGNGFFRSAVTLPIPAGRLAIADLNSDGFADIVSLVSESRLDVLLGREDGTFTYRSGAPGSGLAGATCIETSDLQNDGRIDLVIGHASGVSVLPGNGDGTFFAPRHFTGVPALETIAVTDLTGDGFDDVIGKTSSLTDRRLFILTGRSDGTFAIDRYPNGILWSEEGGIFPGDLNGDGRVDLIYGTTILLGRAPVDLAIRMARVGGSFGQTQRGTYTLTITNAGSFPTASQISVQATTGTGAQVSSLSGTGWACGIGGWCYRSDPLAPGTSFPTLTAELRFAENAPLQVETRVTVATDQGVDVDLQNNTASDAAPVLRSQSIAWGTLPNALAGSTFPLSASSTSGLPVSFVARGACAVAGLVVSVGTQGTCSITASQMGNNTFLAALDITRTFNIAALVTTVALGSSASTAVAGTQVTLTATIAPAVSDGKIIFYDDGVVLGSVVPSAGVGRLNCRFQRTGLHRIRVRFVGGGSQSTANSSPTLLTVTANPSFRFNSQRLPSPGDSRLMAADFDGDTFPDLVTVKSYSAISYYRGQPAGVFTPSVESSARVEIDNIRQLAAADFDGDGNVDLIVAGLRSNTSAVIEIRLGRGDGTFGPPITLASSGASFSAGDFNRDGLADLAISNLEFGRIEVLLNKGSGTFDPPMFFAVHPGPATSIAIEAIDMDGDGGLDLAFAADYTVARTSETRAGALIGSGNGTFSKFGPDSIDLADDSFSSSALTTGDLNSDGLRDIVVQNYGSVSACSVTVFLAVATGGYSTPRRYSCDGLSNGRPGGIVLSDFTGDGKLDIVALFLTNEGFLQLFPGVGDGTIQPAAELGKIDSFLPSALAVADWNGDGRLDFAVSARDQIGVLIGGLGPFLRGELRYSSPVVPNQETRFEIVVQNENLASPTNALVTVTTDLRVTLSGTGWTCPGNGQCTRTDPLAPGSSYPPLLGRFGFFDTEGFVTIAATVSGGGSPAFMVSDRVALTPELSRITPSRANAGNTTRFTLEGLYLDPSGLVIEINGLPPLTPQFVSSRSVEFSLNLPSGSYAVAVRNVASGRSSNAIPLRINDPVPTVGSLFIPIAPCRAADTRSTSAIPKNSSRDFTFTNCGVPANATAVAMNVTLVPTGPLGYLSLWPAGQTQPPVSTMNSLDGRIKANAAIVGLGSNAAASIYVTDASHVVLDVNGYFVPPGTPGGLAFYPVQPCRVVDTRVAGAGGRIAANGTRRISGGCLPAQAQAYSLNVTSVPSGPLGYLTLWPDGSAQPTVSTLNNLTGTVVANAAILRAGTGGAFNAFVTDASDLIVDLNGYFAPAGSAGALLFYPMAPCRVIDTRLPTGQFGGPSMFADSPRQFTLPASDCGIPVAAQAYVTNATVLPNGVFGFLTLWPAGVARPTVSTLNAVDGALTSNAAILAAGPAGAVNLYTSNSGNILLDISGYFAP